MSNTQPFAHRILDELDVGIIVLDRDGNVAVWNRWIAQHSRIDAATVLGRPFALAFGDGLSPRLARACNDALTQGHSMFLSAAFNKKPLPLYASEGDAVEVISQNISVRPVVDDSGANQCLIEVLDVSASMRRDQILRDRAGFSQQQLLKLLATVGEAVVTADDAGRIVLFNQQAEKIFGRVAADVMGKDMSILFAGGFAPECKQTVGLRSDGTTFSADISSSHYEESGKVYSTVIIRDISERLLLEEQLRQSQKMESVGQLTSGIAHDFNNFLAVIMGNLDLLEDTFRDLHPVQLDLIRQALSAAERGKALTQKLLAFARRQMLEPKPLNPKELIAGVADMCRRTLGGNIVVEVAVDDNVWNILADEGQLESALVNLAINSRDAMPGGGTIKLTASNITLDGSVDSRGTARTGDFVKLEVIDNGTGMTPDVMQHVFEPFFTTKELGKGTGLGLAMVYGFINQSGGHVHVRSEVGKGTRLELFLPRDASSKVAATAAAAAIANVSGGSGQKILVVEDEEMLRGSLQATARRLGYRFIIVDSAVKALEALEHDPSIGLMMTDVRMPGGMDGFALAKAARLRHPHLKVLYTTGYTDQHALTEDVQQADTLYKPYRLAELAARLRKFATAD